MALPSWNPLLSAMQIKERARGKVLWQNLGTIGHVGPHSLFPITVSTLKQGRLENEVFLCEREENGFTNDYILSTAMKHYFYRRKVLKRG